MLETMRNVQISQLRQQYPDLNLLKQQDQHFEYSFFLKLDISATPLPMKLVLTQGFPYTRPNVTVASRVTHPNVDETTYSYKGPIIQHWNVNSTLTHVIKTIHDEFNLKPPMPEQMGARPMGG